MKTRRLAFTLAVLALLSGMVGGLLWGNTPVLAAAPVANLVVPIAGTADGGSENVALTGRVQIRSTLVLDPDFGTPPSVILSLNLVGVSGVGLSTGARYIATGENNVIRPLVPSGGVEVTFPFFPTGPGGRDLARPVLASFRLTFDLNGQLQRALASFSTPSFPGPPFPD